MATLKFNPRVFRITDESGFHGSTQWDLLTLDGETPSETVYFMLEGDRPSSEEQKFIDECVEDGKWEEITLEDATGDEEFDKERWKIDADIFDGAGDAYDEIINVIKN